MHITSLLITNALITLKSLKVNITRQLILFNRGILNFLFVKLILIFHYIRMVFNGKLKMVSVFFFLNSVENVNKMNMKDELVKYYSFVFF